MSAQVMLASRDRFHVLGAVPEPISVSRAKGTNTVKSAYELAMERLGGEIREYTDEQKGRLAEIDRKYDAKIAQVKLDAENQLRAAGVDSAKQDDVRSRSAGEIASLNGKREAEKDRARSEFGR